MFQANNNAKQRGFKVWQMILTVAVMGLVMRMALGTLPDPQATLADTSAQRTVIHTPLHPSDYWDYRNREDLSEPAPLVPSDQVMPLSIRGDVPGPLLASILREHMPESTDDHAADLRSTLPPGTDPRMIVILPQDQDEPLF